MPLSRVGEHKLIWIPSFVGDLYNTGCFVPLCPFLFAFSSLHPFTLILLKFCIRFQFQFFNSEFFLHTIKNGICVVFLHEACNPMSFFISGLARIFHGVQLRHLPVDDMAREEPQKSRKKAMKKTTSCLFQLLYILRVMLRLVVLGVS